MIGDRPQADKKNYMRQTAPFSSEKDLHSALDTWFASIGLPYQSHPKLDNKSIPDFAFLVDGKPWAYLEVKNGLDPMAYRLADAGDHYEQCQKYQRFTNLPIFLGPFFTSTAGVVTAYLHGGFEPKTVSAFSCIAGRSNVGLFFIHAETGYEHDPRYWYGFRALMRQQTLASGDVRNNCVTNSSWPQSASDVLMVCHDGAASNKVRT